MEAVSLQRRTNKHLDQESEKMKGYLREDGAVESPAPNSITVL